MGFSEEIVGKAIQNAITSDVKLSSEELAVITDSLNKLIL